ncbi:hypothetical protein LNKW23_10890 [Paralimibaculum aggregatum]|uniref:Methyltransferase domain-containing protein n=1 Tax=Paralimibaculum aggregatum TaxID=3036245 RepID=A0ABQ6LN69_9RHOB|nr:methyltransferase domain-containing protein [Limibaculum sp. NKW23]GMG81876.1 hypothetical protein LNKW23_10890 [Limibaculum sp. NKW23]
MNPFKRLERYFSAFFKLGRLARTTKATAHSISVIEPRIDGLTQDLYEIGDMVRRVEGETRALRDGVSGTQNGTRLDAVERQLDALQGRMDSFEQWMQSAEPHLAALESLSGRLAAYERYFYRLEEAFRDAKETNSRRLDDLEGEMSAHIRPGTERAVREATRATAEIAQAGRAYAELTRRIDLMRFRGASEAAGDTPPAEARPPREGLEALLDAFYGRLEDRYRGSREEIRRRLTVYLPDLARAAEATGGKPVLDLGCGRGEWLEVVREAGHPGRGIDLNPVQIAEARAAGLDVEVGDALKALAEAPDDSFSAITAHHLIEHLPFESVTWMTREALRALAPGGVLIYETPNCHNLIVGARTFNIDPTHNKPLPSELLSVLLDSVGFHPVEMRPLHPSETLDSFTRDNRADPYLAELLFGPQDLAAIATKPGLG